MKRTMITWAALTLVIASCQKEQPHHSRIENERFSIIASNDINAQDDKTRTTFAPDFKTVNWEANDKLSIVVRNNGTFSLNQEFSKGNGANEFTGNFTPSEGLNEYFALYPYDARLKTIKVEDPNATKIRNILFSTTDKAYSITIDPGTQIGLDNMDHIHVPLWGKGEANGTESPTVNMTHLTAIFKVTVKNPGDTPINVVSVKISNDGSEKMTGNYRISADANGYPLLASSDANNYAELKVTEGSIPANGQGDFYIMTSRVRMNQATTDKYHQPENLIFEVKTDKDYVTLKVANNPDKPFVFNTGLIHKATVNYTGAVEIDNRLDISKTKTVDFRTMKQIPPYITTGVSSDISLKTNEGLYVKEGSKAVQIHLNAVPAAFKLITNGNSKITIKGLGTGKYETIKEFSRTQGVEQIITLTKEEIGTYTSFEIQVGKADVILKEISFLGN